MIPRIGFSVFWKSTITNIQLIRYTPGSFCFSGKTYLKHLPDPIFFTLLLDKSSGKSTLCLTAIPD